MEISLMKSRTLDIRLPLVAGALALATAVAALPAYAADPTTAADPPALPMGANVTTLTPPPAENVIVRGGEIAPLQV
jgi:hypothetical protein